MSAVRPLVIAPPPGVVATESLRVAEGRWTLPHQWHRSYRGRMQKIGGWVLAFTTGVVGTPRAMLAWRDFNANKYFAVGTYKKLYVYDTLLAQNDITPYRLTGTLVDPFATTSGSSIVTVTHNAHGLSAGDTIVFTKTVVTGNTHTSTSITNLSSDLRNLVASAAITDTTNADIPASTTIASIGSATALTLSQAATDTHAGDSLTITPGVGSGTGIFSVATVVNANSYTFDSGVTGGTNVAAGGGTVSYNYEVPVGSELAAAGYGWGVGPWGISTWGTARTTSTITIEPRVWGLDNFGKILLAADGPEGSLFSFDPTASQPWSRAAIVAAAPTTIRQIVVTPEEYVFALCDGLIVNASTLGDYTVWTPASNNTAFSRTLQIGDKLVGAKVLGPFVTLVWTDGAIYVFQYTGSQFVYNSELAGRDCGLIGPQAAITVAGVAYWMGQDNFWQYNGSVTPMPNVDDIRKYVFDRINLVGGYQCAATYNPRYNEVWFTITTDSNTNPTLLAIFHINDQCWTLHSSTRCSGAHYTFADTRPYMGDGNGTIATGTYYIYQHENGMDAAGVAITSTLTLAPYAMEEALQAVDVEGVRLDTFEQVGSVTMTINTYDEITNVVVEDTEADAVVTPGGALTDTRIAGRYIGLTLQQNTLGAYMRLGKPVAYVRPTARRR